MSTRKNYTNMLITAGGTLGSRVLGLVRDQLIASFFGTSPVAAALLFALSVPNLFRRLLGEGALTAALVPVMTAEHRKGGKPQAFAFINQVFTRGALLMLAITLVIMAVAWVVSLNDASEERIRLGAGLTTLCMPYMPLICLAALFTAGLNIFGRFGITAFSAVYLNLATIAVLGLAVGFFTQDITQLAIWVCVGTLLGGLLQLGIPAVMFWRAGWRPRFSLKPSPAWDQLQRIFLPAVMGAGILQINFFITRFLALNVEDKAISLYYFANRLVELPIGVFAVAISTVIFPRLAAHAEHGDEQGLGRDFSHGMRLILAINIPAAVGLAVLAEPIVRLLFEYRRFTHDDTLDVVPLVWVFAGAMPFNGMLLVIGRSFNALKDTRTQARFAVLLFFMNLVLAPVMAYFWGVYGLACVNLLLSVVQCLGLWHILRRKNAVFARESLRLPLVLCLAAGVVMGGLTYGLWWLAQSRMPDKSAGIEGVAILAGVVLAIIAISAAAYFALLFAMRFPECDALWQKFRTRVAGRVR